MKRIAIIGGGTSGLSAAYYLEQQKRQGARLEYAIYERAAQPGGVLLSEHVDGCLIEAGPDSFLTEKPWALTLCRELGLADQVIGSNDASRRTYIVVKNRLIEMPDGLMFMVPTRILPVLFSPLFSWHTKLCMAQEYFLKPSDASQTQRESMGGGGLTDESVAAFVQRHFGPEMVERLADPLLSGVYGADAADLSVRAALPRFVEMEHRYGSLCRGMLAARRRLAALTKDKPVPPLFSSLKMGMRQMADAILERLDPQSIRTGTAVEALQQSACGQWEVRSSAAADRFDAVILATPAHVAGRLLAPTDPRLAEDLNGISYSSSITVSLVYNRQDMNRRDRGFGFLVPRSENRRILACTFVHNKFPHRAPDDRAILRVFLGGQRDPDVLKLTNDKILATVRREIGEIAGITAEPRAARVYRWDRAMSQPSVGHLDRIARIESRVAEMPGLALAGNYFRGIGVPDCVRTGMEAAKGIASE